MNDNLDPTSRNHAEALALLNDLYLILSNMEREGVDKPDADGEGVYQPGFWARECAKVLGIKAL